MGIDESMWADVAMGEEEEGEEPTAGVMALTPEDAAGELDPMDIDEPEPVGDPICQLMEAATAQLSDKVGQVFASYVAGLNGRIARLEEEVTRLGTRSATAEARPRGPGSQKHRPAQTFWPAHPFPASGPANRLGGPAKLQRRPRSKNNSHSQPAGIDAHKTRATVRTKSVAARKTKTGPKATE